MLGGVKEMINNQETSDIVNIISMKIRMRENKNKE